MSQEFNIKQLALFKAKYLNQRVSDPWGFYRGQCVSLVKQWLAFNNWPMRRGNAIDWQFNGYRGYAFYYNTPTFVPLVGDMAVFAYGPYGHIGIVENATAKSMNVLNQNNPLGSPVHTTTYDYLHPHCVGFLRKL